jgi:prevent-host-death family protein
MKRASVRDLHLNTSNLVKEVRHGEVVVIESRGIPVAELRPISPGFSGKSLPDRAKFLSKFPQINSDSGRFLEEDRS